MDTGIPTIQDIIATNIQEAGPVVKNTVIDKLAQSEIESRVGKITAAIGLIDSFEKELKKVNRNDIITYTSGQPAETMSKNRFDEIQKLQGKIGDLTKLINICLESNTPDSYIKLNEFLNKSNGGGKKEGTGDSQ